MYHVRQKPGVNYTREKNRASPCRSQYHFLMSLFIKQPRYVAYFGEYPFLSDTDLGFKILFCNSITLK